MGHNPHNPEVRSNYGRYLREIELRTSREEANQVRLDMVVLGNLAIAESKRYQAELEVRANQMSINNWFNQRGRVNDKGQLEIPAPKGFVFAITTDTKQGFAIHSGDQIGFATAEHPGPHTYFANRVYTPATPVEMTKIRAGNDDSDTILEGNITVDLVKKPDSETGNDY